MPPDPTDATDAVHELLAEGATLSTLAPVTDETPEPAPSGPRYELGRLLGMGGFGSVHEAYDRVLQRTVALKVLHPHLRASAAYQSRFLTEARLGARLAHPGIVPIHDLGTLPDGRFAFTMPVIRGRTLGAALASADRPPRQRVVAWLLGVARAVAFAHDRGVIHRDLKPANVMIGDYGEVRVLDWGIAASEGDGVGRSGTPSYMAPEQADGASAGPKADVFALGRIVDKVQEAFGPDPDLADLVDHCTAHRPDARPTMEAVADRLQDWVDGALRRDRALAQLETAVPHRDARERARRHADRLEAEARALGPDDDRTRLWSLEDDARHARVEAARHDGRYVQALHAALAHEPDLPEAHAALRVHAREAFEEAEARGDVEAMATLRARIEAHDLDGVLGDFLRGDGRLSLAASPPAMVTIERYVERGRRLVLEPVAGPLPTPVDRTLAMGSYRCRLRAEGRPDVLYPVHIPRQRHWRADATHDGHDGTVRLPDTLPPDVCYVPAGPYEAGTSSASLDPVPPGLRWLDGFLIDRFPVTNARYIAFLDALVDAGDLEQAEARAPSLPEGETVYRRDADGRFHLGLDAEGHAWLPDMPVVLVSWHDAVAFAAWWAEETGVPWRLPREEEWRKAARGVDGRRYPWGDHLESGWARHMGSGAGAGPTSVHDFPIDESPYGLRHAAGQVECWLADRLDAQAGSQERRVLGGSSWSTAPRFVALDQRGAWGAVDRNYQVGFRLAASWPPP